MRAISSLGALALVAGAILLSSTTASAIPSRDPHTHAGGSVTWTQTPLGDPDAINHQHNSTLDFRGGNASYDGYSVWDSERLLDGPRDMWRFPVGSGVETGVEATRQFGHGFIADDFISAIEYSFVGLGWDDDNRQLVRDGFAEWENEGKTRANGSVVGVGGVLVRKANTITGINFDEDTLLTQTNFEIRWAELNDAGTAAAWYFNNSPHDAAANDLELVFNSQEDFNNSDGDDWDSNPDAGEWDFFSVVLHEIGHILGLQHFAAGDGTNLMSDAAASFGTGAMHRFIDTADLQGAVDLYTIPEPAALAALSAILLTLRRRRR